MRIGFNPFRIVCRGRLHNFLIRKKITVKICRYQFQRHEYENKTISTKKQHSTSTSSYKKSLFVKFHNWFSLFVKYRIFSAHTRATPSAVHDTHRYNLKTCYDHDSQRVKLTYPRTDFQSFLNYKRLYNLKTTNKRFKKKKPKRGRSIKGEYTYSVWTCTMVMKYL